jgi:hypothetical protein
LSQALKVKIQGLHTFQNDLSSVPEGALSQADNIVIDRDGEAEPRRGFDFLAHGAGVQSQFSDTTYRAAKLFFYQEKVLSFYGPVGAPTTLAYHDDTTGWVNYTGSFSAPSSSVTMRSAEASQNFYFTTSSGVYKLDAYNGTPSAIGVPPALDVTTTIAASKTPTATTTNTSATLTSVSSVSGLAIGMSVSGTNIPASTYVTALTATTVTLSKAATGSGSGITITFAVPATWLGVGSAGGLNTTAYRVLWGIKDANKNLILGAPSQISQISNTMAAEKSVIVNFSIPSGITTAHFYQVYRSPAVAAGVTPNDEGQLVYEGNPTSGEITYGTVSVLDIVPDSLRGATIYTAQSQEGLVNQNAPPPLADDIAVFRDCLFYGNTSTLQSYELTLLGVGSPAGIQSGDTLTIDGIAYTANTTETASTGNFLVTNAFLFVGNVTTHTNTTVDSISTTVGMAAGMAISGTGIPAGAYIVSVDSGTAVTISIAATASATVTGTVTGPSASQAIRDTALSLVRVINRYASSTVYAYYLSGPDDLPGMVYLQARAVGDAAFTVISSRSTCWNPPLPSSGSTEISNNDENKNAVFYSKPSQPESVPIANKILIGSADKDILRIVPLRDSLFVLKSDGIFRIFGTDSENFQVSPLDNTANLIAPDSAAALNNQIYALTTQGVVSISETGVQIMSRPIESDLTSLTSLVDGSGNSTYPILQESSFGIAYESSRAYYLFLVSSGNDTGPTQYYRYNTLTNTWAHSSMSKACGGVNPTDDKLYLGNAAGAIIDVERKTLTYSDYADYASTQTITDVTGRVITITASDSISAGSIIYQSAVVFGTVESVDTFNGTITMTLETAFTLGTADVLAPIATAIAWVPITLDNPGMSKQMREVTFLFKSDFNGAATAGFSSDINPGEETETISGGNVGGWGSFGWGGPAETPLGVPWGGANRRRPIRVAVPRNHQRASILNVRFSHSYGYSPWILQGLSSIGDDTSERTGN